MKAAVCTAYGGPDVVAVRDLPDPVPKDDEVLVRVAATTVSAGDARLRAARFPPGFSLPARLAFGVARPRRPVLGAECAGVVEAVGARVCAFAPGDRVFAAPGMRMGGHAAYLAMPAAGAIARIPDGFPTEEAAALAFGGGTALHFLSGPGRLAPGERLLVIGASGAVGTAAVQIGKHLGAHVTGVTSARNAELVRSIGADDVIDYALEDFRTRGARWDVILDAVGGASAANCRQSLTPRGRLILAVASLSQMLAAPFQSLGGVSVIAGPAPDSADILQRLAGLAASGAYRPVVDSRFPLADIAAAHRRVDTGRKTGSVIVTMG